MAGRQRALLIASPFQGLLGPLSDVEAMDRILTARGFEITPCYNQKATRNGILQAWRLFIASTGPDDTVIIYFSGHGGLVESPRRSAKSLQGQENGRWRYQFIVPIDFDQITGQDFSGITDVELSHLLRDTTAKTENVTTIFDCCYAGRMSRDPSHGDKARPRRLPEVQPHSISAHISKLEQTGQLPGEIDLEGNPKAVRIAAASSTETAWEYQDDKGNWHGAMTEGLIQALSESQGRQISWRTTLLRVCELVNIRFPQQHPQVEGPDSRTHFSLYQTIPNALVLKSENNGAIIEGGRVLRVHEGNRYHIMPFGCETFDTGRCIGEALVTNVNGFRARASVNLDSSSRWIPNEGALAILKEEALYRWPIEFPDELPNLRDAISKSSYVRCRDYAENVTFLAKMQQNGESVNLLTSSDVVIATQMLSEKDLSQQSSGNIVKAAEQLARAQHLLSLDCENSRDMLLHSLEVTFGLVVDRSRGRKIQDDGNDHVTENDSVYVELQNRGGSTLYVSVFDINIAGKIALISRSSPKGIELQTSESYVLGESQFKSRLDGLKISWPAEVPRAQSISEHLIFIITNSPVDLGALASPNSTAGKDRSDLSNLEKLVFQISTGSNRNVQCTTGSTRILYSVYKIPFYLQPLSSSLSG